MKVLSLYTSHLLLGLGPYGHKCWSHVRCFEQCLLPKKAKISSLADGTPLSHSFVGRGHLLLRLLCLTVLILGFSCAAKAQEMPGQLLSLEEYLEAVVRNHPTSRRAALLRSEAAAARTLAAGSFDPLLFTDYETKTFKGTEYWRIGEGGLLLPTMGGLEFSAGYRWASGDFLNSEFELPARGQAFAGLKANLLQGLLTDERRTALNKAKLLEQWNEIEIAAIQNDLIYDASLAYIQWAYYQVQKEIINDGLALAADRLIQTRQGFRAGELPALDTLETFIILQERQTELAKVEAELVYARTLANQFLWNEQTDLTNLYPSSMPISTTALQLTPAFEANGSIANNPDLIAYDFKLQDIEIERRLKAQKQLPKLSLKYELLADVFDFTPSAGPGETQGVGDFLLQDNKFGINFSMPLFMRQARGDLQLNEIKRQQTELDRRQKEADLGLKLAQFDVQIQLQRDQLQVTRSMVNNYQRLLEAEQIKFNLGESSVFLLNARESKLLDARLKLAKIETDLAQARASRRYILGGPPQ